MRSNYLLSTNPSFIQVRKSISAGIKTLAFIYFFTFHTVSFALQKSYFVALNGNDLGEGSFDKPFASIKHALEVCKMDNASEIEIVIRGGMYFINESLVLDNSLTNNKTINIKNYKDEKVTLSGGIRLDSKKFKKVSDLAILNRIPKIAQNQVYETNLLVQGITNLGKRQSHGFKCITTASMEVFCNQQPLTLARWPNDGTLPIHKVLDPGSIRRNGDKENKGAIFNYIEDRPSFWKTTNQIWLKGVFAYGYADADLPVARIDATKKTIQLQEASHYGIFSTVDDSGKEIKYRNYYFYNVLEELDSPGEWFVDDVSKKMYVWPPTDLQLAETIVSQTEVPLVVLKNTKGVTFSGIHFAYTRGMGLYAENTISTSILHCEFSNMGTVAISLNNPLPSGKMDYTNSAIKGDSISNTQFLIQSCKISNTGTGGIILSGGNRKNLTSANNVIENCEISQFCRLNYFSCPAITLAGVGNKVNNCYIHDGRGQAIMYSGNNHEIVFNHFTKVVTEISDQGAVYTGRDPSSTGTIIRDNFFNNVKSDFGYSAAAVYIDDGSGGIRVLNNVFYNSGSSGEFRFGAVHINGGGNNSLENNYFITCERGISMNAWSTSKWKQYLNGKDILKKLTQDVDVRSTLYVTRYPYLKNILDPKNELRRVNNVSSSLVFKVGQFVTTPDFIIERNTYFAKSDPGFVNMAKKQFDLVKPPAQLQKDPKWRPVQFDKIGLIKSK